MIQFFAVLTGVLGFLSFPTYSLDFCIWFTLVPLLVTVSGASVRRSFCLGWLAAVVGFCGAFPWVVPTIARFESVSLDVAFLLSLPALAYHAVQVGLFGAFAAWALRHSVIQCPNGSMAKFSDDSMTQSRGAWYSVPAALSIAAAWVVLEWGFPKVFPWSFATVLSDRLALIQIVEVTGIWGVSFVIAVVNVALAMAIIAWRARRQVVWHPAVLAASLVLVVWGVGNARLKAVGAMSASDERPDISDRPLVIIAVQGNISAGPRDAMVEDQTFSIYRQLTLRPSTPASSTAPTSSLPLGSEQAQDSALILWPETTIRAVLPETEHYREALFDVAEKLQRPMLVGSLDAADHEGAEFNSLFVVAPDRALAGVYHKARLLPFGESAPLLGSWWRTTGRFTNGDVPHILRVPVSLRTQHPGLSAALIAPSICYEALFPGFFNDMVRHGADFLVNITDDSWFGNGNAPWQHLQGAVFRAVETRRPLVRASNSGISAIIEPTGQITTRTELFTRTVMQGVVIPTHGQTLYVRWGDWFAWLCLGLTLLPLLVRSR